MHKLPPPPARKRLTDLGMLTQKSLSTSIVFDAGKQYAKSV